MGLTQTVTVVGMRAALAAVVSLGLLAACGDDTAANVGERSLDGEWRVVRATVDGVEVVGFDAVEVTIDISGGSATGSTGCNDYDTEIAVAVDTITFGEGAASEQFCEGLPGEIEAQFYEFTSGSAGWSIDGGVLTLTTPTAVWVLE